MTATEKWEDGWFRKLHPKYKLLWMYILDRCDMAGFWEKDFEVASFFTGYKYDEEEILTVFEGRLVPVDDKLFVPKFIKFQYGCTYDQLDEQKPIHKAILKVISKYPIDTLLAQYHYPIDRVQDKEKEKDKEKDKDKDKAKDKDQGGGVGEGETHFLSRFVNENLPRVRSLREQMTSEQCQKLLDSYGEEKVKAILEAMDNYKKLTSNYVSVYKTARNWLERDNNEATQRSTGSTVRRYYQFDPTKYPTLRNPKTE